MATKLQKKSIVLTRGVNMKEDNTKLVFFLNLGCSIFGIIGGLLTGSIAIFSGAIHDFSDSLTIGVSSIFEHKEKAERNKKYNILNSFSCSTILITSSVIALFVSIYRLVIPTTIHGLGMILFSFFGLGINGYALFKTSKNIDKNETKINVPMLLDCLGWLIILIVAIIIQTTNITVLDPTLAIIISLLIVGKASKNVTKTIERFTEEIPNTISIKQLEEEIKKIENIKEIQNLHIAKVEETIFLNMQIVVEKNTTKKTSETIKEKIKGISEKQGIAKTIIEILYDSKE